MEPASSSMASITSTEHVKSSTHTRTHQQLGATVYLFIDAPCPIYRHRGTLDQKKNMYKKLNVY